MIVNDPEVLNRVAEWQRKAADGSITLEECREAVKLLRANRMASAEAAAKSKSGSKSKAKASPPRAAGDLLSELEGL